MTLGELIAKIDDEYISEKIAIQLSSDFRSKSGVKKMIYSPFDDTKSLFAFEKAINTYTDYEIEKIRIYQRHYLNSYLLTDIKNYLLIDIKKR